MLDVGELVASTRTGAERPLRARDVLLTRTGAGIGSPVSVTALDPQTGRKLWVRELGRFIYGAAATTSNVVVFERDGYQGSIRRPARRSGSSTRPRAWLTSRA